jgi:hypothetical protein
MKARQNAEIEVVKLARLVAVEPDDLAYFEQVDAQDIRDLRDQVTVVMFDADRQMLQRVANATRLIPTKLAAVIGEQAFGPLLCARVTGLLEPSRAVDIAGHLPIEFLAELSVQLDPRRASRVIAEMPADKIAAIAKVLARRGEYITMGRLVSHLSKASLAAALDVVDDEALLRTAYVMESKSSIGALVALLSADRLEQIIRTASSAGLWPEALEVLRYVSDDQRGWLGDLAAGLDDEILNSMVKAAQADDLWASVLPVTRAMSPDSRERFATLASVQTRPVLATIVDAAAAEALWAELLVLLPVLPPAARRRVAALAAAFGRQVFEGILEAAHEHGLWSPLILFAVELEKPAQKTIAESLGKLDDDVLDGLLVEVYEQRLELELLGIIAQLAAAGQKRVAKRISDRADDDILEALTEAAGESSFAPLQKEVKAS